MEGGGQTPSLPFTCHAVPLRWARCVIWHKSLPPACLVLQLRIKGGGKGWGIRFPLFLKSLHSVTLRPPALYTSPLPSYCSRTGLGELIHHRQRPIPDPLGLMRKKAGSGDLSLIPRQQQRQCLRGRTTAWSCHPAPLPGSDLFSQTDESQPTDWAVQEFINGSFSVWK